MGTAQQVQKQRDSVAPAPAVHVTGVVRTKRNSAYILPAFAKVGPPVTPLGVKPAKPTKIIPFDAISEGTPVEEGASTAWTSTVSAVVGDGDSDEDEVMVQGVAQPLVDLETLIMMTNQLNVAYKAPHNHLC